MFELWPPKKYCKRYGENYMSVAAGGNSYPGNSLPTTKDDTMKSRITQSGGSGNAAKADYPQSGNGNTQFPELAGLPT